MQLWASSGNRAHVSAVVCVVPTVLLAITLGSLLCHVCAADIVASTIVTNTTGTPFGVHVDPTTGTILYSQYHSLHCIHPNGTTELLAGSAMNGSSNGIGAAAAFYTPWGIARSTSDPNDAFVVDYSNHCVRRVALANRNVSTLAGLCGTSGSANGVGAAARFFFPVGIALYHNTTTMRDVCLYVADFYNNLIRRVDLASVNATTFAGIAGQRGAINGHRTTAATFSAPLDLALDANGAWLYVVDHSNHCVRAIEAAGDNGNVVTLAGTCGPASNGFADGVGAAASFSNPRCIVAAQNEPHSTTTRLYVVEARDCAIRQVASNGNVTTVVGGLSGCRRFYGWDSGTPQTGRPYGVSYYERNRVRTDGRVVVWERGLVVADNEHLAIRRVVLTRAEGSDSTSVSQRTEPVTVTPSFVPTATAARDSATATASYNATMTHHSASPSVSATATGWSCGVPNLTNVSLLEKPPQSVGSSFFSGAHRVLTVLPSSQTGAGASPNTAQLAATPLPRVALLAHDRGNLPLLLLGLSLQWDAAQRWEVASVRSAHHHDEAVRFNATQATYEAGRHKEVTLLLWPPLSSSMGWLLQGWGVYAATEIALTVGLSCAAEGGNTTGRVATVHVEIPAPGAPRVLEEKVETTTSAVLWSTAVGGPGAGSAVGRVAAVRSLMLCGSGDDGPSGGGLLGLEVAACGDAMRTGTSTSAASGAIVGNVAILLGAVALLCVLVALCATLARVSLGLGALRLAAPSVLLPIWITTLPSTAAASAELFSSNNSAVPGCDVGLALVGLLTVCVPPLSWICFVMVRLVPHLGLMLSPRSATTVAASSAQSLPQRIDTMVHTILHATVRWSPQLPSSAPHATQAALHARQAHVMLLEYRVLWYALLDCGVLVVSGLLAGVSGSGSHGFCVGAAASIAVLYGGQLVVCALSRPFLTLFAFVHGLMTLTLSATSVGLQAAGLVEANRQPYDAASLERQNALSMAAAVCDLFVIGITALRVVLDAFDGLKAMAEIVQELRAGAITTETISSEQRCSSSSNHSGRKDDATAPSIPLAQDDGRGDGDEIPMLSGNCVAGNDSPRRGVVAAAATGHAGAAPAIASVPLEGLLVHLDEARQQWSSDLVAAYASLEPLATHDDDDGTQEGIVTSA